MCWHRSFPAVPGVRGSREQLWVHRQPSLPALPTGDNSWCIWWVQGGSVHGHMQQLCPVLALRYPPAPAWSCPVPPLPLERPRDGTKGKASVLWGSLQADLAGKGDDVI